jgi:predicted ferric reductase
MVQITSDTGLDGPDGTSKPTIFRRLRLRLSRGALVVAVALAITTALWIAGRITNPAEMFWPWLAPSQLAILWSFTCASIAIVAVVRAKALEPLFGGLDRAVHLHKRLGISTLLLLTAHVIFLAAYELQKGGSLGQVFVPFWSADTRTIDILVFYALIGLGLLAYDTRLRHERWLFVHRFIGLLFLIGTGHASLQPGTIYVFEPLRTWIFMLLVVGTVAWLYRVFLFRRFGPRFQYQIEAVEAQGDEVIDLVMHPVDRRMMYEPGTFVFINVPGLSDHAREFHPFSLSSTPVERELRISVRQVGDFTTRLGDLTQGTPVEVYGPFGSFTPQRFAPYRRLVWLGSGIGITPFLGMLAFELSNNDFRRIWLYYVARNEADAVYDTEIRDRFLNADSYIDYTLWLSREQGRISAQKIADDIAPLDDYAVMICGHPQFVSDLARQFRKIGLPPERIILEELQFRPSRPLPDRTANRRV